MSHYKINEMPIPGLRVIKRKPLGDSRGYLERLFCQETLNTILHRKTIRQINHTFTKKKGTVRGLHFQYMPYTETKIVSCLKGKIWDVAVDLRKGSPTFMQHHSVILSEDNFKSFIVPDGFAHGFQTLTEDCEMLYFHTNDYVPEAEGALNAKDPALDINWPLDIQEMSDRDQNHPIVAEGFEGVQL